LGRAFEFDVTWAALTKDAAYGFGHDAGNACFPENGVLEIEDELLAVLWSGVLALRDHGLATLGVRTEGEEENELVGDGIRCRLPFGSIHRNAI
jgi:hypothetical protein